MSSCRDNTSVAPVEDSRALVNTTQFSNDAADDSSHTNPGISSNLSIEDCQVLVETMLGPDAKVSSEGIANLAQTMHDSATKIAAKD